MTALYQPGDTVLVNGQKMVIGSWPEDNVGPFFAVFTNNAGGEVQGTYWAGQVQIDGEPIHTSSSVELVEAGDGVESTASLDGVADDPADEPEPSLSEDDTEAESVEELTE